MTLIHATREKTPYGDIFIKIFPVQTFAAPDQFPFLALVGRSVQQAREPCQRDDKFPPVVQGNAE